VSATQKPLPDADGVNLFPPNLDYAYFENAERYPFVPRPAVGRTAVQPVNAWWLADASLLAYATPEFAKLVFARAGLTGFDSFDALTTQAFVAHNDDFAIVVFRGTEIKSVGVVRDVCLDLELELVDSGFGGKVHAGAKENLDSVWHGPKGLQAHLRALSADRPSRTVWLTGHSLGAATATVAAQRIEPVAGLYTFGSPRTVDEEFYRRFAVPTFRFVNNNDFVARLPPPLPLQLPSLSRYHHVGTLEYFDSEGRLRLGTSVRDRFVEGLRGALAYQFQRHGRLARPLQVLMRLGDGTLADIPFDALADHAPLLYALRVWNGCVVGAGSKDSPFGRVGPLVDGLGN
jgi:triacylglycerol lipase